MTWHPHADAEVLASLEWRKTQWVRELDDVITRVVFEELNRPYLDVRLHRALHDYAGRGALRQLRLKVHAHLRLLPHGFVVGLAEDSAAREDLAVARFLAEDRS